MSLGCSQVISSNIKVSIVPNTTCLGAPILHQIKVSAAATVGATTLTLALDSAFTAASGAYAVGSSYALVPGTLLTIAGNQVEVVAPNDGSGVYFIKLVDTVVNVKFIRVAITIGAIVPTYFAIPLCLKKSDVTTTTTTLDNTTNCTGTLFTQINVGFMKVLDMAGFMSAKDYGYYLLTNLGVDLKSVFFAIDYDGRFLHTGTAQLTDPSITNAAVKQLADWTLQGQIQSLDQRFESYVTAAELVKLAAERGRYGMRPAVDVTVLV